MGLPSVIYDWKSASLRNLSDPLGGCSSPPICCRRCCRVSVFRRKVTARAIPYCAVFYSKSSGLAWCINSLICRGVVDPLTAFVSFSEFSETTEVRIFGTIKIVWRSGLSSVREDDFLLFPIYSCSSYPYDRERFCFLILVFCQSI